MRGQLDYLHLRAWGHLMGSFRYYIEDQLELAREDKAPQDVIYVSHGGGGESLRFGADQVYVAESGRCWMRFAAVTSDAGRALMERYLAELRKMGA